MTVVQADGVTPAPFASLIISQRNRFCILFWCYNWLNFVTNAVATVYGKTTLGLNINAGYHIDAQWTGVDGKIRRTSVDFSTPRVCPVNLTIKMPR